MPVTTPLTQADLAQAFRDGYASDAIANGLKVANTGPGSSLGSLANGTSILGMMLSAQMVYVAAVSRLVNDDGSLSSTGQDIDSFFAPFGIARNGAGAASGEVQLAISGVATSAVFVPVGAILQTSGISTTSGVQFEIIADLTNHAYDPVANGYTIAVGQSAVNVSVVCLTAGTIGNVALGAITQPYNTTGNPQIVGITSITNTVEYDNGTAAETDEAFVARGQARLAGGTTGTPYALYAAAMAAMTGLTVQIGDGLDQNGNVAPAVSTVFVNTLGQSSAPSAAVISAVSNAVLAVKPAGMTYSVLSPNLVVINGDVTLKLDGSQTQASVIAAAQAAFALYIDDLGMTPVVSPPASTGQTVVPYAKIIAVLQAVSGVAFPSNLHINGGYADISGGYGVELVAGTLNVNTV